ncbi:MAG: 16S rRNA (cytosine(1402)-N(4))-methyltransferase RsmH [Anaerolineales bacterium]|nr:16S rRNA (cytosine(1402)-N(4))-methyltransferase RsmH [Anaerolineales bacterium]MCX7754963.1 16S rRNA (cytosine(1402)-N(4))-methyltransferase RsmH [Anaerolineales bacterium]MDW8277341.1 16S rRNA (cytosine(1402)-N(4))-methyltransferase RsmH [Anaerolineales bacterium]
MDAPHQPVLYEEIIHALRPVPGGRYIDGTLGAGGHSAGLLEASAPTGEVLAFDLDPQAITLARARLAAFGTRIHIVQASYVEMTEHAVRLGWQAVDGILLDLGVSSMQLDTPERGFSFLRDAPLDMRFSPAAPHSAADLVNSLPEDELAEIFFRYGEERRARRIARAIVQNRPIATTGQLADLALKTLGKTERIHPATRLFQALRIVVNGELEAVETVLPVAINLLRPGGRLAVIAFHSLEDRIVKETFRRESTDCLCPPRQPVCTCVHRARLREINRKPIQAGPAEVQANPRARSAKLRIAEKL